MRRTLMLFVPMSLFLLSCGGGGGDGVIQLPPEDVSGVWDGVATNAGSAILTGCTGDFASFNGLTVAGISSGANCTYSGPLVTTQSGNSYTHLARTYSCDSGDYGSTAGGGNVNGTALAGQLDVLSTYYGTAASDFVQGTVVAADTISLSQYRITSSGSVSGSCNISPALNIMVTIYSALESSSRASRHGIDAFSLPLAVNAYRARNQ